MTRSILDVLVLAPIVGPGPDAAADDAYADLGRLGGNPHSANNPHTTDTPILIGK